MSNNRSLAETKFENVAKLLNMDSEMGDHHVGEKEEDEKVSTNDFDARLLVAAGTKGTFVLRERRRVPLPSRCLHSHMRFKNNHTYLTTGNEVDEDGVGSRSTSLAIPSPSRSSDVSKVKNAVLDKDNLDVTLLFTLEGHKGPIRGCALSPDARMLCTVSDDRTALLWDVVKGTRLPVPALNAHTDAVVGCAFSSTDPILATCSADSSIKLWDTNTFEEVRTLSSNHVGTVRAVAFSPDGLWLASASDSHRCELWDIEKGTSVGHFDHIDYVYGCAFSSNGTYLASTSRDKTCKVWDMGTLELVHTLTGHTGFVWSCTFSDDERSLITVSADKSCKIWDIESGLCTKTLFGHNNEVNAVEYATNNSLIVSCSDDRTVRCWDFVTGEQVAAVRVHDDDVSCCSFGNSTGILATCSTDRTAKIFAVSTVIAPVCKIVGPGASVGTKSEVILRAVVSGQPKPRLQWFKDDVPLANGEDELVISCADPWHTGTYQCVATNQIGSSNDSYTLEVNSLDEMVTMCAKRLSDNRTELNEHNEIVRQGETRLARIRRDMKDTERNQNKTEDDLARALRDLEEIQRRVERLKQLKATQSEAMVQLKADHNECIVEVAGSKDRIEMLTRERAIEEQEYQSTKMSAGRVSEALKFCEKMSNDRDKLPVVIQTALNFPNVLEIQMLACERLRSLLASDPAVHAMLPQPQTSQFLSDVAKRFPIALAQIAGDLVLLIDHACPAIVTSVQDHDVGRLIDIPSQKLFTDDASSAPLYSAVVSMVIRAALPLMESFDSAVTKAIRDGVHTTLVSLLKTGPLDRSLSDNTVQRISRMEAIFRQFDHINKATTNGNALDVLSVLKGDGIREVAVSTVHHAVMTIAQTSFAIKACLEMGSKGVRDALESARLALKLASGRRLDRLAIAAVNMYSVASFLNENGFSHLFAIAMDQNVQSPELLRSVLDVETLMAPPFLQNRAESERFVLALSKWTPPVNVNSLPLWRASIHGAPPSLPTSTSPSVTRETHRDVSRSPSRTDVRREATRHQQRSPSHLSRPTALSLWSRNDVQSWLGEIGLSAHVGKFRRYQIEGKILTSLTDADLGMLGISEKRERAFLLRRIAELARGERG